MPEHDNSETARAACRQFDLHLPAYLEGEDKPQVVTHARQCPFCGVVLADLELILSQGREMLLEEPPATLWANIRATLAAEGIFREPASAWHLWFPSLGTARHLAPVGALACLVIFSAALLGPPGAFGPNAISDSSSAGERTIAASALYASEDTDLVRTIGDMEKIYQARETSFEPAVKATYQKSLECLNASIRECLNHCRREPTNTLAREYLVAAYTQKAQVLASALEFDAR